ncbi:WD repeat-containing protein 60 [Borealophlyctis nickersoniae]|nr:WD repeat-containing protein 60 [Borealophlyctis nickersoniae]
MAPPAVACMVIIMASLTYYRASPKIPQKSSKTTATSSGGRSSKRAQDDAWLEGELAKLEKETLKGSKGNLNAVGRPKAEKVAEKPPAPSARPRTASQRADPVLAQQQPPQQLPSPQQSTLSLGKLVSNPTESGKALRSYQQVPDYDRNEHSRPAMLASTGTVQPQPKKQGSERSVQSIAIPSAHMPKEDIADEISDTAQGSLRTEAPEEALATGEPEGDADYGDYGEDFEEYDEDFDDFDEGDAAFSKDMTAGDLPQPKDIMEVQKALEAENERASSRQSQRAKESDIVQAKRERVGSDLPPRQLVDYESARKKAQKAKIASLAEQRMAKRAKELSNLIELDVGIYDIFDLAPLNEYELYIRNYGSSNTVQAYTQSNEDSIEHEVQTDDWDVEDKWCQAPPDLSVDVGSGAPELPWLQLPNRKSAEEKRAERVKLSNVKVDSARLLGFLRKASQVMDVLLDENSAHTGMPGTFTPTSSIAISQGMTELGRLTFLTGRHVVDICFAPTDYRLILTAWSSAKGSSSSLLSSKGILCLWRLTDPASPYRILTCECEPTSCCFAPTKPTLIFAGTSDGSLQVWDLQAPSLQSPVEVDGMDLVLCRPSYCTDGLYTMKRVHEEPIRAVVALHQVDEQAKNGGSVALADAEQSFQICSVDDAGNVQLWTPIELLDDSNDEVERDFGMAVGSRVKLLRSSSFSLRNPNRNALTADIQVHSLASPLQNSSRLFFGLASSEILQESRFRDRVHPRVFRPSSPTLSLTADPVTSISFCPHDPRVFVAGYGSGLLGLYDVTSNIAVRVWEIRASAKIVRWSPHRPAVFFVLDGEGVVYVWDLAETEAGPVHTMQMRMTDKGKAIGIAVSTASQIAFTGSQQNLAAGASRNATIAVAFESGAIEVHMLVPELTEVVVDEETVFDGILGSSSYQEV